MKVLVLGVKSYDFKNDAGEKVAGTKVYYVTNDAIEGVEGYPPMCVTVGSDVFPVLPGIYNFDFSMKQGKNNKPELVVVDSNFVSHVSIVDSDSQLFIDSKEKKIS